MLLLLQYKYVQLPTSADNVCMALPAFADAWLLLNAGRRAHNSKPATDGTDTRTDARQFHRPCSAYNTLGSANNEYKIAGATPALKLLASPQLFVFNMMIANGGLCYS